MSVKYRKKPVIIEAVLWTGSNLHEVISFIEGTPPVTHTSYAGEAWYTYEGMVKKDGLKIETLEGRMSASVGDYIIRGVSGEFYPCKPDIFGKTYEVAE